jgi:hypothetical protein
MEIESYLSVHAQLSYPQGAARRVSAMQPIRFAWIRVRHMGK